MNQMIGYDVEQKAAKRKMNAWTSGLSEAWFNATLYTTGERRGRKR